MKACLSLALLVAATGGCCSARNATSPDEVVPADTEIVQSLLSMADAPVSDVTGCAALHLKKDQSVTVGDLTGVLLARFTLDGHNHVSVERGGASGAAASSGVTVWFSRWSAAGQGFSYGLTIQKSPGSITRISCWGWEQSARATEG